MQSKKFIELLTGSSNTPVQWQIYHDSDKSDSGKNLACQFYDSYESAREFLEKSQTTGCGVYITINETDGRGRKINNITRARACFIDGDNQPLPSVWAVEPDIIVSRNPLHWHAYWLLNEPVTDFETWSATQYQLATFYGVKDRLFDLPRVMRAPGFVHLKNPNAPEEYKLIYANDKTPRHALADLITGHALTPIQLQEFNSWQSAPKLRKNSDAVDHVDDSPENIEKYNQRLSSTTPETGDYNNTLFRAAAVGKDYGLSEPVVIENITLWWSSSWGIPVEHAAIKKVTNNAYRYGIKSIGAETTAGKFKNAPPITQQVGKSEDLRTVIEGIDTASVQYGKNHTINARVFLQQCSNAGIHYITVKQETYIYEGTYWRRLEPKELETHVLNEMLPSRPQNDHVSGTCKLVSLLTTNNSILKSPCWISHSDTARPKPRDLIAFKNGILDISNNSWLEHTSELFYTHCVDYDYNPAASHEKWIDYLKYEVFDSDMSIIHVLQEWMGYMLVSNYDYQKLAVFLGAPRSGKGTIAGVIRHIVGAHNVIAPTLTKLLNDPTLDMMIDKPVAIIGDAHKVAFNKRDEVLETLKMISGCDPITFGRKYLGSTTCKFPTRFTLCANKMPEFLDSSGAMAGRLIIIPFCNSYLGKEDPNRLVKLLDEAPGILNWCLEGLRRLQLNGRFTNSAESEEFMEVLREDLSPVSAFMKDCCEVTRNPEDYVEEKEMFELYKQWCAINDMPAMKSKQFKSDFASCSYKIRRRRVAADMNGSRPRVFVYVKLTVDFSTVIPGKFGLTQGVTG